MGGEVYIPTAKFAEGMFVGVSRGDSDWLGISRIGLLPYPFAELRQRDNRRVSEYLGATRRVVLGRLGMSCLGDLRSRPESL